MPNRKIVFALIAFLAICCTLSPRIHAEETKHKPDVKAWKNLRAQGIKAMEHQDYKQAISFFTSALAQARNFGPEDDRLVDSLTELSDAFWKVKAFKSSEPLLREAARIRHGDPNAALEAVCAYKLALNCEILKDYAEAGTNYERVETIISRKLGPDDPFAVEFSFHKGRMWFLDHDYTRAEPVLKRAVELSEHPSSRIVARDGNTPFGLKNFYLVASHPDYVNAIEGLNYLNAIYTYQRRLPEEGNCLKEILKILDAHSDKADPELLVALQKLAKFYLLTTNYVAAEPVVQRGIKLAGKVPGTVSDDVFTTADGLARVYEQQTNYAKAGALFEEIAAGSDSSGGRDTRQSALATARLARFYFDQGQFEKAEPLYRRQAVHAEKFGSSLEMTPILADQVVIYSKLNRDADLEATYKKQILVFEKMLGPNTRALVTPLNDCSRLLRKNKRDAEAEPLEARAHAIEAGAK